MKESGYTNTTNRNYTEGLSGVYKHMAVLLYHAKDRVNEGMNNACSSVPQLKYRNSFFQNFSDGANASLPNSIDTHGPVCCIAYSTGVVHEAIIYAHYAYLK